MQFQLLISEKFRPYKQVVSKINNLKEMQIEFFSEFPSNVLSNSKTVFVVMDEQEFIPLHKKGKLDAFEDYHHLFLVFYKTASKIADALITNKSNCEFYDYALVNHLPEIIESKKNYSEKLRNNVDQDRFKLIVQNMPVMVDAFDANLNYVFWNRECERVTGYSAQEIVNNPNAFEMLYPDPEYRKQILMEYEKRGNNFRDWELKLTTKNGQQKIVAWSNLSDIYQVPGWAAWAVGFDVTEQYQIKDKLQGTEFIFNVVMEIAEILNQWQTEEQIIEKVFFKVREFVPFNSSIILFYDYQKQIAEIIGSIIDNQAYFRAGKPIPLKELINHELIKSGQVVFVDDLSIYSDKISLARTVLRHGHKSGFIIPLMYEGQIVGSISYFFKNHFELDETKKAALLYIGQNLAAALKHRKQLQELNERIIALENERLEYFNDLKKNELRLRSQFENLPIPTLIWRKEEGRFVLVDYNDMALAATYGRINEYLGKSSENLPFSLPQLTELLEECFVNEITLETQIKITWTAERTNYYSLKMAYVAPDTIVMHIEDITQHKQNEVTIAKLNQLIHNQLKIIELLKEERSIFKENLFPVITSHCEALWQNKDLVKNRKFESLLSQSHEKVLGYLQFFSDYYSVEADRFFKQPVNLDQLIDKVISKNEALIKEAGVEILTFLEQNQLITDESLLGQIFEIVIQLSVARRHPQRKHIIRFVSGKENDQLKIVVKDNGIGMTEAEQIRLREGNEFNLDLTNESIAKFLILKKMANIIGSAVEFDSIPDEGCQIAIVFD